MIAKPAAMPGICGARKPSAAGDERGQQQRPQPVDQTAPGRCSGIIVAALASASRRAIGGLDRRAAAQPQRRSAAATHPPAGEDEDDRVVALAPSRRAR